MAVHKKGCNCDKRTGSFASGYKPKTVGSFATKDQPKK